MKKFHYVFLVLSLTVVCFESCMDSNTSKLEKHEAQLSLLKIKLGKTLFFDKQLSRDYSISCASCHIPSKAFTDGQNRALGFHKREALRNTPTLFNVKFATHFMMDGGVPTIEQQILVPLQDSNEMAASMRVIVSRLSKNKSYQHVAQEVFHRNIDPYVLTRSLAAYVRSIEVTKTKFDKFWQGDSGLFTKEERLGWNLFSEKLNCTQCHTPPLFTNFSFKNNGAVQLSVRDFGRYRITGKATDKGKFKVPTLRSVDKTAPYMHDGSIQSLVEVIDLYAKGGYGTTTQDPHIQPLNLSKKEKSALVHFLKTL